MESVCDDPEVIAANILVRAAFARLSCSLAAQVLAARSSTAVAYSALRFPLE